MKNRLVGARYAEAFVKLGKERGELERIGADLGLVAKVLFENKDVMRFLEGPQFADDDKKKLINKIFGKNVSEVTVDFLSLLIDKYRISLVFFIIEQFQAMRKKEEGFADAHVTSSIALSDKLKTDLAGALSKITNKKVRLNLKVDPDIIGGLIVSIGNRLIDASIKGRLRELKENLLSVRVH